MLEEEKKAPPVNPFFVGEGVATVTPKPPNPNP
jgi:hypothetical protein